MAQIIVRNLDDNVKSQLVMHAKLNGHSMEEEVRQILQEALLDKKGGLGTKTAEYFKHLGLDFDVPELKGSSISNPFEVE